MNFFKILNIFRSDPNQQYYPGGQPGFPPPGGYPPPHGYPQGGYPPPQGGYPPPQGGYPPPGGYPMPGAGGFPPPNFGGPGFPPQPGFAPAPHMPPPGADGSYGAAAYDPEDPEVKGFDFTDESIRKGFIRKVYSILMVTDYD